MIILQSEELDYDDVLLLPNRSKTISRKDVNVSRDFQFYHSPRVWTGTPIFAANMSSVGTFKMGEVLAEHEMCTAIHKHYGLENLEHYFNAYNPYLWYTTGIRDVDLDKLSKFSAYYGAFLTPNIVIDVPNGYTDDFVYKCMDIRKLFPKSIIMAGNVCTGEMTQELILHGGVDIVKVGIGPGRNCSTRMVTGVGRPQLSAVIECASAAHNLKNGDKRLGLVCADGGCKEYGHVNKAFCGGADFVMLGGMFAGTDECDGEWTYSQIKEYKHPDDCELLKRIISSYTSFNDENLLKEGDFYSNHMFDGRKTFHVTYDKSKSGHIEYFKKSLTHYGMSSQYAQDLHYGGKKDYITPEGIVEEIPYKGPASNIAQEILGSIRSCCSYIGTLEMKHMSKHARFVKVNRVK